MQDSQHCKAVLKYLQKERNFRHAVVQLYDGAPECQKEAKCSRL